MLAVLAVRGAVLWADLLSCWRQSFGIALLLFSAALAFIYVADLCMLWGLLHGIQTHRLMCVYVARFYTCMTSVACCLHQ